MFTGQYSLENRAGHSAPHVDGCEVAQRLYEVETLAQLVKEAHVKIMLEIGTYQGGTLAYWMRNVSPGATIITLDTRASSDVWKRWTKEKDVTHLHLQRDAHAPETLAELKTLLPAPLDFLFIDGDHTLPGVTQDFESYGPLVRKGGMIAFHDILNPAPGRNQDHIRVSVLWKRIQNAGYLTREIIAHPEEEWGGIGVVYI